MKLKGKKLEGSNIEYIVIPRGNGEDIILKAQAVEMEEFAKIYPDPKPPMVMLPGSIQRPNFDDKFYKAEIENYGKKRMGYMILKSLEATEDLTWEKCDIKDPNTYDKWEEELKESGFTEVERNRIMAGIMTANCLNEAKIEEARSRFLASLQLLTPQDQSSSLKQELNTMQNGVPVKDMVSNHQV